MLVEQSLRVGAEVPRGRDGRDRIGGGGVARGRLPRGQAVAGRRSAGERRADNGERITVPGDRGAAGEPLREKRRRRRRWLYTERRQVRRIEPEPAGDRVTELAAVDRSHRPERRGGLRGAARAQNARQGEH